MFKRSRVIAVWGLVLLGFSALATVGADEPPAAPSEGPGAEERLGQSYVLMTRAEQAWREGDRAEAEASYEEVLDLLASIEADYPGWGTHVVRSRFLICQNALEMVKAGKPAPADLESAEKKTAPDVLGPVPFALSGDSADTAMKALRAGIEERDETVADLRSEIRKLKEENRKLTERADRAEGKRGEAAGTEIYPAILKAEARRLIESGSYSNAFILLTEIRQFLPEDPGIPLLMGVASCRRGDFETAVHELEPLTKARRVSGDIWLTLGVAYLGVGNLGRSRNAFEKALDQQPDLTEAHFNLAQILLRLKKPDAELARKHYLQALQKGGTRDPDLERGINQALLNEQARKMKR
ncbi:MAG: tetratricopeptide repeat protein [Kiritimatiellia bacterium]